MKSQNCIKKQKTCFLYKKWRRGSGSQGYSVSEVVQMMNNVIKKVNDKNIRHFGYMIGDEMISISDYRFLKSNTKFKVRWNQFIN